MRQSRNLNYFFSSRAPRRREGEFNSLVLNDFSPELFPLRRTTPGKVCVSLKQQNNSNPLKFNTRVVSASQNNSVQNFRRVVSAVFRPASHLEILKRFCREATATCGRFK